MLQKIFLPYQSIQEVYQGIYTKNIVVEYTLKLPQNHNHSLYLIERIVKMGLENIQNATKTLCDEKLHDLVYSYTIVDL